jgi:hypothetical protein
MYQRDWQTMAERTPDGRIIPQTGHSASIFFPAWTVFAALLVLPVVEMVRFLRFKRVDPLVCRTCGYDLRATPDRCPECGALAEQVAEAS